MSSTSVVARPCSPGTPAQQAFAAGYLAAQQEMGQQQHSCNGAIQQHTAGVQQPQAEPSWISRHLTVGSVVCLVLVLGVVSPACHCPRAWAGLTAPLLLPDCNIGDADRPERERLERTHEWLTLGGLGALP